MLTKALIAVRSGSIRVQNKNIRPFAGSTLLEVKINQLKRISLLDGIIVNSNDERMLDIADRLGCETILRDAFFATNNVSMSDVYVNMAQNCNCDIIVYSNVTNPLIKDHTIHAAIDAYVHNSHKYDSLNTAHLVKEFMFKDGLPINYDLRQQPRSQDLPDIFALNFAVNILTKETMINCRNVVGLCPYIYGIDQLEATDIDNPIDFDFAEFVFKNVTTHSSF